jgi:DNA invertase Pin-like site-specific DNA recombinase
MDDAFLDKTTDKQSKSTPLSGEQRRRCSNDPLSTEINSTEQSGFQRCSNVLRNENEWREVCAMMKLGYARVSTSEQDTAAQVSALKSAGCEKIFREGDVLIVSRLDRLSRSLRDLLMIMERIKEAEAGFRSLTEAIDTNTAPGRMMMQMVGAFAEFERAILRERTKAGLDAARKHGRIGGRRPKLRPNQRNEIVTMVSAGTKTAADAARLFNVHPATVSRLLAGAGAGTISVKV